MSDGLPITSKKRHW